VNSIHLEIVRDAAARTSALRQCGGCQECCEQLGVIELAKPHQTRCVHERDHKCDVYDLRPISCRNFVCCWLLGTVADEELRPDRCGVVISPSYADAIGQAVLDVHQARPRIDPHTLGLIIKAIETVRTVRRIQYVRWHPYSPLRPAAPAGEHSDHQKEMFYFPSTKSPFLMVHVPREKVPGNILQRMSGKVHAAERGGQDRIYAEALIGDDWINSGSAGNSAERMTANTGAEWPKCGSSS
jgi:hypothetical protein